MKTKMPTEASTIVSLKSQSEDTHFLPELQIFFEYLQDHVASCTMVCAETGILQKNACRHKRQLEESNLLWELYEKRCGITGRKVAWLTTNPELVPNIFDSQLNLFEFDGGEL